MNPDTLVKMTSDGFACSMCDAVLPEDDIPVFNQHVDACYAAKEVDERLCRICGLPLPKNTVFESHIMCRPRRVDDDEDGWNDPARVRRRIEMAEKIRHNKRIEVATKEWERHQKRERRSHRIHMRPIGYTQRYSDTVAHVDQNYGLTKTSFAPSEHYCRSGFHHCYLCHQYYPCEDFRRDATRSSGLMSKCRACDNAMRENRPR